MTVPIVFSGPSLTAGDKALFPNIDFRSPAAQGDILRATRETPEAIGLVDGYFGDRLAVHQKEILEAIALGVPVFGAASIGALRAAELSDYGMVGVGDVFRAYRSGRIESDADVAVAHGPEELGFRPTSISMVDVRETVESLRRRHLLTAPILDRILRVASSIFFVERSWLRVSKEVHSNSLAQQKLFQTLSESQVQRKRIDAISLLIAMSTRLFAIPPNKASVPLTKYYRIIRERSR